MVHMDEAYVPLAIIIDLGRSAIIACLVIHNRGSRNESLRIRALPLLNFGMQTLDQNLADLVKRNVISPAEARGKAKIPDNFPG